MHVKAAVNVRLSGVLGSDLYAAFVSMTVGLLLLSVAFPFGPPYSEVKVKLTELTWRQWYFWIGGLLGCCYLTSAVVIPPKIGFSLYYICNVLGQLFCSVTLDHFGVLNLQQKRIQLSRAIGIVLLIGSAVMAQDFTSSKTLFSPAVAAACCVATFIVGCLMPLQALFNRSLAGVLLTRVRAVCVSFFVASLTLLVASAIAHRFQPLQFNMEPSLWWAWLGGAFGVCYLSATIALPSFIGLSFFFMLAIAGQLAVSLVLDDFGFLDVTVIPATPQRIAAVCCACVGCVFVQIDVVAQMKALTQRRTFFELQEKSSVQLSELSKPS